MVVCDPLGEAGRVLGGRASQGGSRTAVGRHALRDRGEEVGMVLDEPTVCKPHSCGQARIDGRVREGWGAEKLPAGECVTKTTGVWPVLNGVGDEATVVRRERDGAPCEGGPVKANEGCGLARLGGGRERARMAARAECRQREHSTFCKKRGKI